MTCFNCGEPATCKIYLWPFEVTADGKTIKDIDGTQYACEACARALKDSFRFGGKYSMDWKGP